MRDQEMRVAVIGASGTLGKEIVKQLSERHEVVSCARTTADVPVDLTSSESIREMYEAIGPVDAVICAAGDGVFKPLSDLTDEDFAFSLASKLMGQVNLVRVGSSFVQDNGSFTLTSGMTSRGPIPGSTTFSMQNGAIESFARAAAADLPRGIRINAVCPQWVDVTLKAYGMDPAWGVPVEQVAPAYIESVEGDRNGAVIDAGWRYDWAANYVSIGAS
jgi:NAD(P)-dependent dehydrogenase (short-subunit alcohol dehydrogenase family)